MPSKPRAAILVFLVVGLAPLVLLSLAFLVYDPLAIFHAPWGRAETVHKNMRLQAAGVIRHADFDSVLLGTSVLENTSASEASAKLGGRFVNLSLSAGDFYERSLILSALFRQRRIATIVYSLDFIYLIQKKGYKLYPLPSYEFLYDSNPFNDPRAYLNRHYLDCLVHWSGAEACIGRPVGLDRPNAWMGEEEYARRFGGMANWCRDVGNYQIADVITKLGDARRRIAEGEARLSSADELAAKARRALAYVDDNILRHVEAHPETRFYLVFPPYHRAKFAIWYQAQPDDAHVHQAVVRHLAARAGALPNLRLHGFEDQDFLDDIAHYKDLDHVHPDYNSRMLDALRDGANRLTPANIESYLTVARQRGAAYSITALHDALLACSKAAAAPVGQP